MADNGSFPLAIDNHNKLWAFHKTGLHTHGRGYVEQAERTGLHRLSVEQDIHAAIPAWSWHKSMTQQPRIQKDLLKVAIYKDDILFFTG